jgi:hypothetical protein
MISTTRSTRFSPVIREDITLILAALTTCEKLFRKAMYIPENIQHTAGDPMVRRQVIFPRGSLSSVPRTMIRSATEC